MTTERVVAVSETRTFHRRAAIGSVTDLGMHAHPRCRLTFAGRMLLRETCERMGLVACPDCFGEES